MGYDEGLAERLRALLPPGAQERRMFGGIGWMVDGNLLFGVLGDDMVARVGPEATQVCLQEQGTRPFDFTGRAMNGWVVVEPDATAEDHELERWAGRCRAFHRTLPPK